MIIAIDGPAGTGKSTVAQRLAQKLNLRYFDTGAMYRSFTLYLQKAGLVNAEEEVIVAALGSCTFTCSEGVYRINGADVSQQIRSPEVTQHVARIASISGVREYLVRVQRKFGSKGDAVFEGRDIGSVVFPQARVKIFLTASLEVRAQRRAAEFPDLSMERVRLSIARRDEEDMSRAHSPLIQCVDAFRVDTSFLSADSAVSEIEHIYKNALRPPHRPKWLMKAASSLYSPLIRTLYHHHTKGLELLPEGGALIIANHASLLDPLLLSSSLGGSIYFFANSSLFNSSFSQWLFRRLNTYPIQPHEHGLRDACALIKEGHKVVIFPEGQLSPDGRLLPFQRGASLVALSIHCPVVPVYIRGASNAWKKGRIFPSLRGASTSCTISTPIQVNDITPQEPLRVRCDRVNEMLFQILERIHNES